LASSGGAADPPSKIARWKNFALFVTSSNAKSKLLLKTLE
jgi:hypothetical protein